jgi:hypothetical protein
MKLFLPFFLISILSFAQSEPEEVFENRIFEAGLSFNMPQGDYLKKIKTDYGPENSIGFSTSYLINPLRKKDELSLVFIGGEFNFESVKQSNFTGFVASDGYYLKHNSYSFRAKAKYVPILTLKKFLPSISFALGPKVFSSKMMELINQDQVEKIGSIKNTAMSYAVEIGLEAKRVNKKYVKVSLVYDISNSVKIWDRNGVTINVSNNVIEPLTVAVPQSLVLKVAIINYR